MATFKFSGIVKGDAKVIEAHFDNFLMWQCVKGSVSIKRNLSQKESGALHVSGTVTGSPLSINEPDIVRCFESFGVVEIEKID